MGSLHTRVDPDVNARIWKLFIRDQLINGKGYPENTKVARGDISMVELRIKGRVQEVGYRLWLRDMASRKGVIGKAENHADGSVKVTITGRQRTLEFLTLSCARGPSKSKVESIELISHKVLPDYVDFSAIIKRAR